MRCKSHLGT